MHQNINVNQQDGLLKFDFFLKIKSGKSHVTAPSNTLLVFLQGNHRKFKTKF